MINAETMTDNQTPPMANNPYASATSAYGLRQEANMSGFEVAAKLYDGMIRFIGQAKNAHAAGKFEDMVALVQKTNKILMALQSALNFDDGGETSIFLNDIYMESFKRLTLVLREEDPQAEFDSVRDLLQPVAKMWNAHAENAKKGTPDTHIAAPEVPQN